jgi:hypothetical protein
MANIVRDPRQHSDAIIPDLSTNSVSKFSKDQVAFVYGSIWKQRYFTKIGDDYFPLPVQWEVKNKKWSKYVVPLTGGDWRAAFLSPRQHAPPTGLCATAAIRSATTFTPSKSPSGTSVANAATVPAVSTPLIQPAPTYSILLT